MSRSAWWVIVGAVALTAALLCYFKFERVTAREFVGFSGEAVRNPLLALQRLMQRMGAETEVLKRAVDLDAVPGDAALFLARDRYGMTTDRNARLLRWVESGGHLIVEVEPPEKRDALLDALSVGRKEINAATRLGAVVLPGTSRPLRVVLPLMALTDLKRRNAYSAAHQAGTAVLHFEMQRGSVTVLPSFLFMTNAQIGRYDHAALAWGLVQLAPKTSLVLIAPHFERPSIMAWLTQEARGALVTALVLLVLWLWRIAMRFGPVQSQPGAERRRLLDHLRASGRFIWASHAGPRLLAAVRESCLAKIVRTRPGLAGIPQAEQAVQVAALTALPLEAVDIALHREADTPRSFTAAVQTLQLIQEKLTRPVSR